MSPTPEKADAEATHSPSALARSDLLSVPELETDEKAEDTRWVEWDGPDNPNNPQSWSTLRSWWIVGLVSAITFNICMVSTLTAPAVPLTMGHFNNSNAELESFVVSVYIIGFIFGPLIVAPLSELYGRAIILHTTNILFLVFTVIAAVSTNLNMFIVFRLFTGLVACTPLTLGGGFIADLMAAKQRAKIKEVYDVQVSVRHGPLNCFPTLIAIVRNFHWAVLDDNPRNIQISSGNCHVENGPSTGYPLSIEIMIKIT